MSMRLSAVTMGLAVGLFFATDGKSQLPRCVPATCSDTVMGRTCQESWPYAAAYGGLVSVATMASGGAVCNLVNNTMVTFQAQRDSTDPTNAFCSWTGDFMNSSGSPISFICVINMADGLPVELMDLSVD